MYIFVKIYMQIYNIYNMYKYICKYIYLWGEGTILFILDDAQFHRYFRLNGVQPAMGHPSAGEEAEML